MAGALRVRDIMTTDLVTLSPGATVTEAARTLTENRVSGAPVVERGRIIGVLSTTDLVDNQLRPTRGPEPSVADVMTHVIWAVRPGDAAVLAVRLMLTERVHRALVVDDEGRLLGILTPLDVLRAITEGGQLEESGGPCSEHHGDPATGTGYVDLRDLPARTG